MKRSQSLPFELASFDVVYVVLWRDERHLFSDRQDAVAFYQSKRSDTRDIVSFWTMHKIVQRCTGKW